MSISCYIRLEGEVTVMKILSNLGILNSYNKDSTKVSKEKDVNPKKTIKEDKVEFSKVALERSGNSNEVGGLKAGALNERDTKINDLRDRIKAGTYKVSTASVADAIIDSKKV